MGAEQQLLQHLYNVLVLGQTPDVQPTPDQLNPKFTPNQKLLQAAAAYADAFIVKGQGTNPDQARKLAQQAFQAQVDNGHNVIPEHETNETLTASHAQLWHAAAAGLLYAALQVGDEAVIRPAQLWWRGEAALCHLTAWATHWNLGSYKVICAGARGGSRDPQTSGDTGASQNSVRDLDYELLLTGRLAGTSGADLQSQGQYNTAPILLLRLTPDQLDPLRRKGTGAPLAGPNGQQGPWGLDDVPYLASPLSVRRAGNQHASWFDQLNAFDPQYQAGVDANGPWYKFFDDTNPPLTHGGPSPFAAPAQPDAPVQQYGLKKA
jgi:hypothetical protein